MSQIYKIMKLHEEGKNRVSRGIVIPKEYLAELRIRPHGEYVKVILDNDNDRIIVQKLIHDSDEAGGAE